MSGANCADTPFALEASALKSIPVTVRFPCSPKYPSRGSVRVTNPIVDLAISSTGGL
ncbi:hypothetical protein BC739_000889 [Kutzneria viridogrisea]|uniref:Uncharacterized protein n=2 Tax=Kutzneria TaxID=43356 RepID=W5WDF5_9PSEU|nr:hypothetical protein KALB_5428 [Kutzneria albida DSM 43870]MBA8923692.1 hypothetical protein [Kutzneria viridogrisea]